VMIAIQDTAVCTLAAMAEFRFWSSCSCSSILVPGGPRQLASYGWKALNEGEGRKTKKKWTWRIAQCHRAALKFGSACGAHIFDSSTEDIVETKTQRSLTLKIAFQSRMWVVVEGTPVTKGERYPHSSIMHITPGGCVSRFATRTW
jgi:hypothetical protein